VRKWEGYLAGEEAKAEAPPLAQIRKRESRESEAAQP
jgi:hypothetical protein